MLNYEWDYLPKNDNNINKNTIICGCDEAGRGPSAGPLFVAAVVLPYNYQNELINDSKKLTEKKRELAYHQIVKDALDFSIIKIEANEVDKLNPKQASRTGMQKAINQLKIKPHLVITDFEKLDINIKQINLTKGDSISINVAAASILAKVERDKYMLELAKKYPHYDFENNKGYYTKKHAEAVNKYGLCPEHRLSYKNIKPFIK
ncbi:ribonuclease HII [[Mycoplasma] falconis]|uniref:Ribonuclease HII n=1 Tax=[Mycoplasma] falconis TaxID=92403 RepID=A0A501XCM7_9BACT|nr:ribonuclease HII [[Mycoplasma] falconis]TPE58044.1 ribonuclease HII [[Mycoplasma] falconis]